MKIITRFILISFFILSRINSFSSNPDSLALINNVKQFAYKVVGIDSIASFYTNWSKDEKPYFYLYISEADKVAIPPGYDAFYNCGTDENNAAIKAEAVQPKGYHVFCYKTYANSSALLNKKLISYSDDAKAFIVFHELIHNYIELKQIKVPYEFNESLADVIGNYGALEFGLSTNEINNDSVKKQIQINEEIYSLLNKTIKKVNNNPKKTLIINSKCNTKLTALLTKSNSFQKDRFSYTVNNAFLLKNQYYSKNYFLLKKVYHKQKSIKAFLEIISNLPADAEKCADYLRKYD